MKVIIASVLVVLFVCFFSSTQTQEGPFCPACIKFWDTLRYDFGCDGNATICKWMPYFNASACQTMIDAVCAAGCQDNPAECAYVACCAVDVCTGSNCTVNNTLPYAAPAKHYSIKL